VNDRIQALMKELAEASTYSLPGGGIHHIGLTKDEALKCRQEAATGLVLLGGLGTPEEAQQEREIKLLIGTVQKKREELHLKVTEQYAVASIRSALSAVYCEVAGRLVVGPRGNDMPAYVGRIYPEESWLRKGRGVALVQVGEDVVNEKAYLAAVSTDPNMGAVFPVFGEDVTADEALAGEMDGNKAHAAAERCVSALVDEALRIHSEIVKQASEAGGKTDEVSHEAIELSVHNAIHILCDAEKGQG
jgi:hypothetical protein